MTAAKTVADVLDAAADLLTPEGAWTQGAYARDAAGRDVNPHEKWREAPDAVCFCLYGALAHVSSKAGMPKMAVVLSGLPDTEWNDHPGRKKADVIAKLREAASLARATPVSSRSQGDGHGL